MHHLAFCQGMTLYLMSMELHLQVREARKQANLTQQELARLAGVSRMDVSRLENGENLTMRMFLKIVNALPSLTHLSLGSVQLTREEEGPPIHDREQLQRPGGGAAQRHSRSEGRSADGTIRPRRRRCSPRAVAAASVRRAAAGDHRRKER